MSVLSNIAARKDRDFAKLWRTNRHSCRRAVVAYFGGKIHLFLVHFGKEEKA
jgi:hypothetical protein